MTKEEAARRRGLATAAKYPLSIRREWSRKLGLTHKPNIEGCAKGGRISAANRLAKARAEEAIKNSSPISGQVKQIVQNPSVPWKGIF